MPASSANQFLELGIGNRERFGNIDRCLPTGNAIGSEEKTFTPEQGMFAQTECRIVPAEIKAAKHEGIEQFGFAPMQFLRASGEFIVSH